MTLYCRLHYVIIQYVGGISIWWPREVKNKRFWIIVFSQSCSRLWNRRLPVENLNCNSCSIKMRKFVKKCTQGHNNSNNRFTYSYSFFYLYSFFSIHLSLFFLSIYHRLQFFIQCKPASLWFSNLANTFSAFMKSSAFKKALEDVYGRWVLLASLPTADFKILS